MQRDLVERARKGDHDAFAVLAGATIGRLDAAARLILRDPDRAQDAVQETLVRCWRDLPTLRDPDRFDAWLHRLFLNACRDELRSAKRRSIEVELPEIHPLSVSDYPVGLGRPGPDRAWRPPSRAGTPHRDRPSLLPWPAAPGRRRSDGHPAGDREVAPPSGHPGAARGARFGCASPPRADRRVVPDDTARRPRPDALGVARRSVHAARSRSTSVRCSSGRGAPGSGRPGPASKGGFPWLTSSPTAAAPPVRMAWLLLIALLVVALVAGVAIVGSRLLTSTPPIPQGGAAVIAFASQHGRRPARRRHLSPSGPMARTCAS